MDEVSGKGAINKLPVKKRSSLTMRESSGFQGRSPQPCNRLSCSSRLNTEKNSQCAGVGWTQKAKSVRSSICLSGSKEVTGSSSRNGSSASAIKIPKREAKMMQISLKPGAYSPEISSTRNEIEVPEVVPPPGKIQKGVKESSNKGVTVIEVGSSSSGSTISKSRNISSIRNSTLSKAKSVRHSINPNIKQCELRNLRCNFTVNMVQPSRSLSQKPNLIKRKDYSKDRISEGKTSKSRGKKTAETLPTSRNGVLISESRRTRNDILPEVQRRAASVKPSGSSGSPSERSTSTFSNGSRVTFSRLSRRDLPLSGNASSSGSSYDLSNESVFGHTAASDRPQSIERLSSGFGASSPDSLDFTSRSLINWESFQQYTMEGVSEVLSALERFEQEDMAYEQLVSLESNLFLNSLNFYDQHRDMRMDIDNMSYEELLALEERMGNVSTALTEEALSRCLKREYYRKIISGTEAVVNVKKDDVKCSICQEEYVDDDKVGRLQCKHMYHADCISQWLRLKNWCPICKSSVEPSPSSPCP
ncbi:hypothetical protein SAY86_009930 [Trapa natans]|uniref:RING-type E3 ubiquitin transferase n=1 Tax=Trapa natans TaxID=22666 RepID=A0AAN7QTE3_TRANT|nr:hypothetical protein SAY86_009930 [Trapa natans]